MNIKSVDNEQQKRNEAMRAVQVSHRNPKTPWQSMREIKTSLIASKELKGHIYTVENGLVSAELQYISTCRSEERTASASTGNRSDTRLKPATLLRDASSERHRNRKSIHIMTELKQHNPGEEISTSQYESVHTHTHTHTRVNLSNPSGSRPAHISETL